MNERKPALECAFRWIQRTVERLQDSGGNRLPKIRTMARQAGVSELTLSRAVRRAEQEGLVWTRQGKGVFVSEPASEQKGTSFTPVWEQMADRIARDIRNGVYAGYGVLPSYKELVRRYGSCYQTIRKALLLLCERSVVQQRGSRFSPASVTPRPQGTIVMIMWANEKGEIEETGERTTGFIRSFTDECLRRGVDLVVYAFTSWDNKLFDPRGNQVVSENQILERHTVIGFVFLTTAMPKPRNYIAMIHRLLLLKRPVVVVNEQSSIDLAPLPSSSLTCVHIQLGSTSSCGRAVGHYLVAKGHRHVAYISHLHNFGWSSLRYQGVVQSVHDLDPSVAVYPFTADHDTYYRTSLGEQVETLQEELYHPELSHLLRKIASRRPGCERLCKEIKEYCVASAYSELAREMLFPLFERALGQREITAWVAANDETALAAMAYLRSQRIRVPESIGVIGFDDSAPAFFNRLTSYNFNVGGVSHAAIYYILNPRAIRKPGLVEMEIEGYISTRATA